MILKALEEIKNYISQKELIITGGTAIDMALRLKGGAIYDDKQIPDYDFISTNYFADAYEIAKILFEKGFPLVSVIPALHYGTVAVRIDFMSIADITYAPNIHWNKIKTFNYAGMKIIHPHYQILDQHYSLSHPYENPPVETVFHRWLKDMKRFDAIWKYYPVLIEENQNNADVLSTNIYNISIDPIVRTDNSCLGGNESLIFWLGAAKKMGFESKIDVEYKFDDKSLSFKCSCDVPFSGVHMFSDDFGHYVDKTTKYFEPFLDRIPRHIETLIEDKTYKIYDNYGQHICAHQHNIEVDKTQWFCGIQLLMMMLMKEIVYPVDTISSTVSKWYLLMFNIVKWASEKPEERYIFLPNAVVYGDYSWSQMQQICVMNTFGTPEQKAKVRRPPIIHAEASLPPPVQYSVEGSLLGNYDGKEVQPFETHKINVS